MFFSAAVLWENWRFVQGDEHDGYGVYCRRPRYFFLLVIIWMPLFSSSHACGQRHGCCDVKTTLFSDANSGHRLHESIHSNTQPINRSVSSLHPSIHLSTNQSINRSTNQPINQSIIRAPKNQPINHSIISMDSSIHSHIHPLVFHAHSYLISTHHHAYLLCPSLRRRDLLERRIDRHLR